jgi:hypothetical protein
MIEMCGRRRKAPRRCAVQAGNVPDPLGGDPANLSKGDSFPTHRQAKKEMGVNCLTGS